MNSFLTPKQRPRPQSNPKVQMRLGFCGISFQISAGNFRGTNKYIWTNNLFKNAQLSEVNKIRINLGVQMGPADKRGKSKHSSKISSKIDAVMA